MLQFTIPILKISASGVSYLQRTLLKPPQSLASKSLECFNPSYKGATGNTASPNREMQKSSATNQTTKWNVLLLKTQLMMSFSIFCPSCANQTAYLKYTFHTICQRLLFHLLFAQKATIFIPISHNPKRKAGKRQFNSRLLLNTSQCAPWTPV